jgi:hypothetical protein
MGFNVVPWKEFALYQTRVLLWVKAILDKPPINISGYTYRIEPVKGGLYT